MMDGWMDGCGESGWSVSSPGRSSSGMWQESQAVADVGVSAPLELRFCPGRGKSRPDAGEPRDAPLHSPALPASPPPRLAPVPFPVPFSCPHSHFLLYRPRPPS